MYNYETALRGDRLAAPAAPADTSDHSSATAVMEAFKKENDSLKDMIDVLTKERGSNGILEGKYLAQIKKTKTLTVQLESEKTRTRQLQVDLDAALAKVAQADDDAKAKAQALSKKKGKASGSTAGHPVNSDEADGATPDAAGEVRHLKERVDRAFQQLRTKDIQIEEMKRENAQLRHIIKQEVGDVDNKDVDALLKRTIGASDTTLTSTSAASVGTSSGGGWKGRAEQIVLLKAKVKELERELGTTQSALQQAAAAAAVGAGAANVPDGIRDDGTSSAAFGLANTAGFGGDAADKTDVASWLSLAARTNGGGGGSVGAGAVTTVSAAGRDYEEEERRRLTDVSNQKLLRIRELEQQLEAAHRNVSEEKRKLTALQARFQTLQRQQAQLRTHVETMLEKSATDDELIAAYKEEMELAQQAKRAVEGELADYREQAWKQATHGSGQRAQGDAAAPRTRTTTSEQQVLSSDARRGSGTTLDDQGLVQLRQLLAYHKAEAAALREELAKASAGHPARGTASSSLLDTLNAWWAQALASPPVVAALRRAQDNSCAQPQQQSTATTLCTDGLLTAVMEVLLVAHRHVLAAESRQAALMDRPVETFLDVLETYEGVVHTLQKALAALPASATAAVPKELLERVLEALKTVDGSPNQKGASTHTASTHADFIKKENVHLRERTRVLAEMLEKERQALVVAHKEEVRRLVLDAADSADTTASPRASATHKTDESMAETAEEKDVAERYAALQRQYNDLRKAFNQIQSQSLKDA